MRLALDRCPHCGISKPNLIQVWENSSTYKYSYWSFHECQDCTKCVMVWLDSNDHVKQIWPPTYSADENLPQRAKEFLNQAVSSLHAPAGSVMLTASAIDAMLKDKGYKDGSLYNRIDAAANQHLITREMAEWAHEVRLEANDQRHSDESAPLPENVDAQRCIDFAKALAEFLYVLPARIASGRASKTIKGQQTAKTTQSPRPPTPVRS